MNRLSIKPNLLALALLPLLLVACGGSDDNNDNHNGTPDNKAADPLPDPSTRAKQRNTAPNVGVNPPGEEEKAAFEASKVSLVPHNALNGNAPAPFPQIYARFLRTAWQAGTGQKGRERQ